MSSDPFMNFAYSVFHSLAKQTAKLNCNIAVQVAGISPCVFHGNVLSNSITKVLIKRFHYFNVCSKNFPILSEVCHFFDGCFINKEKVFK